MHRRPFAYGRSHVRKKEMPGIKTVLLMLLLALAVATTTHALPVTQEPTPRAAKNAPSPRPAKLPAPEKIVGDYLKASGGKKRLAALRDATYEWSVRARTGEAGGTARTQMRMPASARTDILLTGGEMNVASNGRSAWVRGLDGRLQTLTGAEALTAKLQATLDAVRLVDYKKQNALARTVALEQSAPEPAYVVEFSTREGARLRYWFGASSKLLLKLHNETQGITHTFADYRMRDGLLVAHEMVSDYRDAPALTFSLKNVRYNTGIADVVFDPPGETALDIPQLLRAVTSNQDELDRRISEYTFTRRETEREINDRGEVKKEKVRVHEIYPVAGGGRALKLLSEDGVALDAGRMAKEEARVAGEIEKLERENEKHRQKRERERAERTRKNANETGAGADGDDDLGVSTFLRACELVAPRREEFNGRAAIVFDFRPRAGFRPSNREESLIAKLVGVIWIDPVDKQVIRLEARLAESFKVGGGLLASIRPGSAIAFEQMRMPDGVWLPRFSQISASAKLFFFAGFRLDATREYSNYKRFTTQTGDATLDAPRQPPEKP